MESLEDKLKSNKRFNDSLIGEQFIKLQNKKNLESDIKSIKKRIKTTNHVILRDELKSMKRVLRSLGYTNRENVIELKGRVACEINTGDEIVLTELIFAGFFTPLDVSQSVSLYLFLFFKKKQLLNK